jgi:hypothetical protein
VPNIIQSVEDRVKIPSIKITVWGEEREIDNKEVNKICSYSVKCNEDN